MLSDELPREFGRFQLRLACCLGQLGFSRCQLEQ